MSRPGPEPTLQSSQGLSATHIAHEGGDFVLTERAGLPTDLAVAPHDRLRVRLQRQRRGLDLGGLDLGARGPPHGETREVGLRRVVRVLRGGGRQALRRGRVVGHGGDGGA